VADESTVKWDQTAKHYFEGGVDHGVLFLQNSNGTYGNGIAWNGLTRVQSSPSGAEANDLYADNILYATLRSAEKEEGTIEAYTYPDEFMECEGFKTATTGVSVNGQSRKTFALAYRTKIGNEVDGFDHGVRVTILYGCTVNPSSREYNAINNDPDAANFSWDYSCVGISSAKKGYAPISKVIIDSRTYPGGADAVNQILEGMVGGALPLPDSYIPDPTP